MKNVIVGKRTEAVYAWSGAFIWSALCHLGNFLKKAGVKIQSLAQWSILAAWSVVTVILSSVSKRRRELYERNEPESMCRSRWRESQKKVWQAGVQAMVK